ncbi:MAG TPA: chemotaxis protein CheB [Moraxellaceae bacterium]|nr:chemotaxis protein CheB [Moraxellaceae bacterium]
MDERRNPRVGVVSDSNLQRLALAQAVKGHGYELCFNTSPDKLDESALDSAELDVWVVDMQDEDDEFLDRLLDHSAAPILFGLEQAPVQGTRDYPRWERRVFVKLKETVGEPVADESLDGLEQAAPIAAQVVELPPELSAHHADGLELVVVLAASLGGPAAVKEFLDSLPKGLPVAFVLAQHIDVRMQQTLTRVLVRHNGMPCKVAEAGDHLRHGELLIAPVESEIDFDETGGVIVRGMEWDGPYSPSIDQMIANVTRRFGNRAGALIFSGMGGDGSISGPQLVEAGGFIWGQTAETCACSSQPDSMRATGVVTFNGSPAELAAHLVEHVRSRVSAAA